MTEPQPTPERITTPDGRSLDLWLAGAPDGNLRILTLVVDTFPQILDELVQGAR